MIFIWDNGEPYDGHMIRLFEQKTPHGTVVEDQYLFDLVPVIERLLQYDPCDPNAKHSRVVAVALGLVFKNGFGPEPLADVLWPSRLFKWAKPVAQGGTGPSNVVPRDEAWQLGRPLVALLVARWKEWIGKRTDPIVGTAYGRVFIEAAEAWATTDQNAVQSAVARRSTAAEIINIDGLRVLVVPKNGTDFQLEELQKIVGGSIEITRMPACCGERIMVTNEEGKILGLPPNAVATRMLDNSNDVVVGRVLVCPAGMVK